MTDEALRQMPKVELHCHLDGSLSLQFFEKALGRKVEPEEVQAADRCADLNDYLAKFALPLSVLKDREALREAGIDFMKTMAEEHVLYSEPRFAPLSSVGEGLSAKDAIEAVLEGLTIGRRQYGGEANLIVCAMRHQSDEENLAMFRAAREFRAEDSSLHYDERLIGVCAADLAGDEISFPMSRFMDLFSEVKDLGLNMTIHAGETGNFENIAAAVETGAARIGHGAAMAVRGRELSSADRSRCLAIQDLCFRKHVGIEMCPISNLQTGAVSDSVPYPMREFLDCGLLVTVSTDNRTVSSTTLTRELTYLLTEDNIREDEIQKLEENAVECAFADDQIKDDLLKALRKAQDKTIAARVAQVPD